MARKNGKSAMAAAIAISALTTEQQGGQIISAAADRDQARLIFNHAKRMVEMDPVLSEEIKVYAHVLEHRESQSVYRSISSEAYSKEGLDPSLILADELHAWPTRELFDVLQLATGARRDPLMLIVSTAGVMSTRTEEESIFYSLYQYGLRVCRGEVEDPTFFMAWWGAAEESDHTDERVWEEANPGIDDIIDREDLRSALRLTPESEFRIKRTNLFVPVETFWLPAGAWDECAGPVTLDRKAPICVGIDVALTNDASAVVIAQRQDERVAVQARVWQNPHPEGTVANREWRMPLDEIVGHVRSLRREFPASAVRVDGISQPGPAFVYDKWGLASTELALEAERGYSLIPVPQQGGWMVEASRRFYEAVMEQRIIHDPQDEHDATLGAHLRHVVPRQVGESGWRLEKPTKSKKIDAAVAIVMAVSQALEEAPKPRFRAFAA
jgi:phage terminase large subunit-like protein